MAREGHEHLDLLAHWGPAGGRMPGFVASDSEYRLNAADVHFEVLSGLQRNGPRQGRKVCLEPDDLLPQLAFF